MCIRDRTSLHLLNDLDLLCKHTLIARQHRDLFQIRHTANGALYHLGQNALVVVVVELTAPCLLIVGSTRLQLCLLYTSGQSFSSPMAFSGGIKIAPLEHSNNKPHRLLEHGVIKADAALCQKLGLTAENPYVYKIVRCVDAVSYTHLDVYKRQPSSVS